MNNNWDFEDEDKFNSIQFDNHIKNNFPYFPIRKSQEIILEKLKKCDDKKYIVIEAPPGTGKSAIAYTLGDYSQNAYILTATKQLQQQYINEFKNKLSVIKGSNNYPCYYDPNTSCKLAVCTDYLQGGKKVCQSHGHCAYYNARTLAADSNIACMNYSYFFTFMDTINNVNSRFKPRKIVVLDECHMLESMIADNASISIVMNELREQYCIYNDEVVSQYTNAFPDENEISVIFPWDDDFIYSNGAYDVNEVSRFLHRVYNLMKIRMTIWEYQVRNKAEEILDKEEREKYFVTDIYIDKDEAYSKSERKKIMGRIDRLKNMMDKLDFFFKDKNKDNWVLSNIGNNKGLNIQPIEVKPLFKKYIDKWATKHFIFMSATILNARIFCEELGIEQDEVAIIRVDSTFEPDKSPIYFKSAGKMNYASLTNTLPNIAKIVKEIISNYSDKRGVIHTGNYRIAQYICDVVKDKRLLMKKGRDTNETLMIKHARKKNSVLVSPSLGTGADFHDDLSEFQIIVKLPFMSLGDARVKMKANKNSDWYNCHMLKSLIQSAGRSTRSEDDYSDTYILDASFPYWINRYKNWLPDDFIKRIRW